MSPDDAQKLKNRRKNDLEAAVDRLTAMAASFDAGLNSADAAKVQENHGLGLSIDSIASRISRLRVKNKRHGFDLECP